MDERMILPGEAAGLLGVTTQMLGYYEEKGILVPAMRLQKGNGWAVRVYRLEDVERVVAEREANKAARLSSSRKSPERGGKRELTKGQVACLRLLGEYLSGSRRKR